MTEWGGEGGWHIHGATDVALGGETMHQAFIVRENAFERPANARKSRTRVPGAPSAQERSGTHMFRRGDAVEYIHGEETNPDERCSAKATVLDIRNRSNLVWYE